MAGEPNPEQPSGKPVVAASGLPPIKFVRPKSEIGSKDYILVSVDTKKLDESWKHDKYAYLPSGGSGENYIGGRYNRFKEWLKANPDTPIEAPIVSWNAYLDPPCVSFTNGRHRFAVLRDMGYPRVSVVIPKVELKQFKKMAKVANERFSGEDVLQYLMKLNHWGKDIALQVLGLDGYGSDFVLKDYPLSRLKAGDDYMPSRAQQYADQKTPFPPIVLGYEFNWTTRKSKLVIKDGNHRVAAAKLRGDKTIKAYVQVPDGKTAEAQNVICRLDITDSYKGETYGKVEAFIDNKCIGYVDFSDYPDFDACEEGETVPHAIDIKYVFVEPEYRRKGIATAMYKKIMEEFPGEKITSTGTTDEGGAFRQSLTQRGVIAKAMQYLWADYKGRILMEKSNLLHTEWFEQMGLPSWGNEFDRVRRGTATIDDRKKTVTLTCYNDRWAPGEVWTAFQNKFPKYRMEEQAYDPDMDLRFEASKSFPAYVLWAKYKGKIYTASSEQYRFHMQWFEAIGLPTSGPEFDKVIRGEAQTQTFEKKVIFRMYNNPYEMFTPNDVVNLIMSKYGYKQAGWEVEDDGVYGELGQKMQPVMAATKGIDFGHLQNILTEMMVDVAPGLPRPILKVVNHTRSRWLGRCKWTRDQFGGYPTTEIEIQKSVTVDDTSLRRILAHELCHHEEFLNYWAKMPFQQYRVMFVSHGRVWREIANRWNAKYGKDFVTETSDESIVTEHDEKPYYVFIWKRDSKWWYQTSLRLSSKQQQRVLQAGINDFRLAKTTDRTLINGVAIASGRWNIASRPEAIALCEKLFNGNDVRTTEWGIKSETTPQPVQSSVDEGERLWNRLKRDFMTGIVYHGTTKAIADIIAKDGFRGLEFDEILNEVLALYGKTIDQIPKTRQKTIQSLKNSYQAEFHLVSTSPAGETAARWAGSGGEVARQIEAYILGVYSTTRVKNSKLSGEPAVVKCRIKDFEATDNYRRAKQMTEGMDKLIRDGGIGHDYTPMEGFETLWHDYINFLCKPEELEVITVYTGSQIEALKKEPLG